MPKSKHPAPLAITIAGDEDRTHYFYDRSQYCSDKENRG